MTLINCAEPGLQPTISSTLIVFTLRSQTRLKQTSATGGFSIVTGANLT